MFPVEIKRTEKIIDQVATGAAARSMRQAVRLSVREVARRMGMSASFVSDLELGRRKWNHGTAKRFTESLVK